MKRTIASILASLALVGAAEATTINTSFQVNGNAFGAENLRKSVRIESPGYDGWLRAGLFQMTGDNGFGDFAAFCVDVFQSLKGTDTYEVGVSLFTSDIEANIDRLYSSAFDTVDTKKEAAAFQVALWEIIYDNGSPFDLDTGDFSMSGNAGVEQKAADYLAGLSGAPTGKYQLTYLFSQAGQDLVTAVPTVPLPGAGLFLAGGLGGLAALRRRKTQR